MTYLKHIENEVSIGKVHEVINLLVKDDRTEREDTSFDKMINLLNINGLAMRINSSNGDIK